jgi:hypothetical protein
MRRFKGEKWQLQEEKREVDMSREKREVHEKTEETRR